MANPPSKPVIVIGAGLSGLTAAAKLKEQNIPVILLEALGRVGGRTYTQDGVDQGAGYVGSTQTAVLDLIDHFNIEKSKVPGDEYEYTFKISDRDDPKKPDIILHSKNVLADLFKFLNRWELLAALIAILEIQGLGEFLVPEDEPWTSPFANTFDSMTVQNWIDLKFPRSGNKFTNARKVFEFICRTPLGIEPMETSFLYFIWYIQSVSGFFRILFPAQDYIVIGGTQQLSVRLNANLPDTAKAQCSKPVTNIEQCENGVIVTAGDKTFEGDRCILAMTPHLRSKITYKPLLPPIHHQLPQRSPMGTTIKVHLFYSERFWINSGYNGNATLFDGDSVSQVYDVTELPNGKPCLQGFFVGKAGRRAANMTSQQRQDDVMKQLKIVFENNAALTPTDYKEYIWDNHTFIGGAPVGTCPTGTLTYFGTGLRNPTGRIHYAGTETSTQWTGYMDGAIRAGHRVADELCTLYGVQKPKPVIAAYDNTQDDIAARKKIIEAACKTAREL